MKMEVISPEIFMGDIIGDLNSRRSQIQSIDSSRDTKIINCLIPLAGTFGYATDLRSMSQGRANFAMEFHRYEGMPQDLTEQLVVKVGGVA